MSLEKAAQEVLDLLSRGSYTVDETKVVIAGLQSAAVDGSCLYSPEQLADLRAEKPAGSAPAIEVVDGTSQQIAQSLAGAGSLAMLNFASARNPGGGFLNGAKAQEEDLCRCSGLYPTIVRHEAYYQANRKQRSLLYTDYAIFSPRVPFFKVRGTGRFLAQPFLASVITAPAPNSRPYLRNNPEERGKLEATFLRRWQNVLCIARDHGVETLLLGAWGCGAFGGDPVLASSTAREALESHGAGLERVVFAIPGKGRLSRHNLEAFASTLSSRSSRRHR